MLSRRMSIEDHILSLLLEPKYSRYGIPVSVLGIPALFPYKKQSIANSVTRLKGKGYIKREGIDKIMVCAIGRIYAQEKSQRLHLFASSFPKNAKKNLLLLFDIPEDRKGERDWFRKQLREFDYEMIQKSVWLGPSPLPKEFTDFLTTINLRRCIKTFKLAPTQKINP